MSWSFVEIFMELIHRPSCGSLVKIFLLWGEVLVGFGVDSIEGRDHFIDLLVKSETFFDDNGVIGGGKFDRITYFEIELLADNTG